MSLNFLSPWYLLGILGVSLPILIHLLTRRHQTHIPFSAVYLLQRAQQRSIHKSRPNRLLLLLIRCLGILALCLALAGPIFSFGGPAEFLPNKPSANVLVLDDSFSMTAEAGETQIFHHAVTTLTDLLERMPENNFYSLIRSSHPAVAEQDWEQGPGSLLEYLKSARPSFQTTDIAGSLAKAQDLLSAAPQEIKRIYLVTDRDKNGWDPAAFQSPSSPLPFTLKVIDVSEHQTQPNKVLVKQLEVQQEFLTNSRIIRIKSTLVNLQADTPQKQVRVALVISGKVQGEDYIDLPAGGEVVKEFTFPYLGRETVSGYVEIQEDGLTMDNRRLFSYQPDRKIPVLVVDGDPRGVPHQHETFYLEKALNPFAAMDSDLEPHIVTLSELSNLNLHHFSMILLCNVRNLPFGYERKLEDFVVRGGALMIGLGDQVDMRFYNEKMGLLLPVTLQSLNQVDGKTDAFRLQVPFSDHRVLKVFTGKTLEQMGRIRFNTFYSVDVRKDRQVKIPMRFTNQYPALVEADFGKGKVFLFTSSLDRDWNDFPIQPTFLPWAQRWVKYGSQSLESLSRRDLKIGEPFQLEEAEALTLVSSPGGKTHVLNKEKLPTADFSETWIPGTYKLFRPPPGFQLKDPSKPESAPLNIPVDAKLFGSFSVNIDPRESAPGKIPDQEILDLFPGQKVEFLKSSELADRKSAEGLPLTTPFFLIMAFMLFLEGWLVRRE